jgi:hypothetical protein
MPLFVASVRVVGAPPGQTDCIPGGTLDDVEPPTVLEGYFDVRSKYETDIFSVNVVPEFLAALEKISVPIFYWRWHEVLSKGVGTSLRAIDRDRRAIDPAGPLRRQEYGYVGDFAGRAETFGRELPISE